MDQSRYSRQIAVPRLGYEGQERLLKSRIAVVGAGGVKSPLLMYLAAAGVGTIRIIDFDRVELSNLNRQILYDTSDIGSLKVNAAARRLIAINPEICVEPINARVIPSNFTELLGGFDLVFEGGDSATSRRDFNQSAVKARMTYIHASAQYNYAYVITVQPFETACFECVFNDLPATHGGAVPIIGAAAGVAGTVAASEAISILSGNGSNLNGRLFFFDGWSGHSCQVEQTRNQFCSVCSDSLKNHPS